MSRCEACGRAAGRPVRGPYARWRYWQCGHCGHAWLHPAPTGEELTRYYNAAYAVPRELYVVGVPRAHRVLRELLRRRGIEAGRMLEVGCSYGAMLDAFRRDGWEVEGIELDARAAGVARSQYGLRVHEGRLEDVRRELSRTYDLIGLYHVLEHVVDPRGFVRGLAGLCEPEGRILIKTPNARSLLARALGGWWEWFAAPAHLHLFSPQSLGALLEREGFAIELMTSRRGDANGTLFEVLRASARRVLRRRGRGESRMDGFGADDTPPLSLRPTYRRLRAVTDGLGAPLDWLLARLYSAPQLLGPELLVLARKTEVLTPARP